MEIQANSGVRSAMFGVPCVVADNFLKISTEEQLKVLLYILRCSGRSCTEEEISLNTGVSPEKTADAILYWQQVNILPQQAASGQNLFTPPSLMSRDESVKSSESAAPVVTEKSVKAAPRRRCTPSELSEIMRNSADVAELFKIAEAALGTLNHTQQNSLVWMYDYLGLKKEVIITLLYYCIKIEKTNSSYIEKIACNWAESEINTLEAAQEEVERLASMRDFTSQIMRLFEMNRRPTSGQMEFIQNWRNEGFSPELIHYAYEKTVEQINKLNFSYINKILISWKDSGFTTVKDVRIAESDYKKNKKTAEKTSSADADKYSFVINKF